MVGTGRFGSSWRSVSSWSAMTSWRCAERRGKATQHHADLLLRCGVHEHFLLLYRQSRASSAPGGVLGCASCLQHRAIGVSTEPSERTSLVMLTTRQNRPRHRPTAAPPLTSHPKSLAPPLPPAGVGSHRRAGPMGSCGPRCGRTFGGETCLNQLSASRKEAAAEGRCAAWEALLKTGGALGVLDRGLADGVGARVLAPQTPGVS